MRNVYILISALLLYCNPANAQLNLQWQDMGPDNLGGPVRGLIIDHRDTTRQTLYAGIMGGGIWKSTDGGNNWEFLGCTGNYAISCMSQASSGNIYIGTGGPDAYATNQDEDHLGNGIYKLDSADNITHLDSTTSQGYETVWSSVARIAINPINENQIITANNGGVYKSTNAGVSWTKIIITNSSIYGTSDVKWSSDGQKVFVVLGSYSNYVHELIRSTDGGNTWSIVDSMNYGFPKIPAGRIEIALAQSNSNIAYLSFATTGGSFYSIYKTSNAGNTWDTVIGPHSGINPFNGQGWYDNAILVSPVDADKIYFGGVTMYTYSPLFGLHKLPDFIYPNAVPNKNMEQFFYTINDHNPDEVYAATNKGVFKTTEGISNFTSAQFYDRNYHLNARDFISIAAAHNGQVIGGSRLALGLLVGNVNNQHFINFNSDYDDCAFSQLDTNYVFIEGYYGRLLESKDLMASFFSALDTAIDPYYYGYPSRCSNSYFSPFLLHESRSAFATNDTVIYTASTELAAGSQIEVKSITANTPFQYTLSQAMSPGEMIAVPDPIKSRLFFSPGCGIWMKRHAVSIVNPDWCQIASYSNANANCFAVTKNGNKVYWGTNNSTVNSIEGLNFAHYGSSNMSDSFFVVKNTIARSGPVQSITIDPSNDSILLITVGGTNLSVDSNVFKSTNAGKTWHPIQVGPKGTAAYSCVIDAGNSNNYIIGTEHGIWTSNDAGLSWHQDYGEMCDVPVFQLKQVPLLSDDCYVLYAATNSRGIWRSYTLTPAGCNTSVGIATEPEEGINSFSIYPNPANSYTTVQFTLSEPQQVNIQISDITGRVVQTSQQALQAGEEKIELNTSMLHPGTYLVSVENGESAKTKLLVIEE